jgi:WD40-like Beta Propeller Repeat
LKAAFIFLLIIGLLTSSIAEKNINQKSFQNSLLAIQEDTTDLNHFLEVDSFKLTIYPPSSGIQFYKDGIVFLNMSKNETKMSPDHISFGAVEAYYATLGDSALGNHTIFSPGAAFSYPCEALTFSPDFKTIYYTRIATKDKKEKIYMAKSISLPKNQTGWLSQTNPMSFCSGNFNYTHPTLSADESMMVFASDKEGTLGGMDLFVSRKVGDEWSKPENLGDLINTSGNEFFPSLDSQNNLFFSSDGLPGYGGYDIFTCKFNGESWDKPKNLSNRINSENDDIAFTVSRTDSRTAFFTRRQKSDQGEIQLFKVSLKPEAGYHNQLTISYIFNGKPQAKIRLASVTPAPQINAPVEKPLLAESKTEIIRKDTLSKPHENKVLQEEKKSEPVVISSVTNEKKAVVVYRVQFLSNSTSKGKFQITINNKIYDTFEYFFKGAYRYTVGEFSNIKSAAELQNACRKSGYPQAFVAAFRNNIRSLDPELLKEGK